MSAGVCDPTDDDLGEGEAGDAKDGVAGHAGN